MIVYTIVIKCQVKVAPRLDVYSPDVVATHWVSIDKLNKENLFYLMSKGLDYKKSVDLYIISMIDFILDKFKNIPDDEKKQIKKQILSTIIISND